MYNLVKKGTTKAQILFEGDLLDEFSIRDLYDHKYLGIHDYVFENRSKALNHLLNFEYNIDENELSALIEEFKENELSKK